MLAFDKFNNLFTLLRGEGGTGKMFGPKILSQRGRKLMCLGPNIPCFNFKLNLKGVWDPKILSQRGS